MEARGKRGASRGKASRLADRVGWGPNWAGGGPSRAKNLTNGSGVAGCQLGGWCCGSTYRNDYCQRDQGHH